MVVNVPCVYTGTMVLALCIQILYTFVGYLEMCDYCRI
jgi:hypothetical protein